MGKDKIRVFEYNLNGKYLKCYESISEFREKYYSHITKNKYPLFFKNELNIDYQLTKNTISFKQRVGQKELLYIIAIIKSNKCNLHTSKDRPVVMMSIKDEVLAEFPSQYIANVVLKGIFPLSTISRQLKKKRSVRFSGETDYYFKYKD